MSESGYSRQNKPQTQIDILDLIIRTLLEHEKHLDQHQQRLDTQLLKMETLNQSLADLLDKLKLLTAKGSSDG